MKVIHLDNGYIVKKNLKAALPGFGIDYVSCGSEAKLFSLLESGPCDLIVTRLELKAHPGRELIKRLNKSPHKNIPVIVLTSDESQLLREELFCLGVVDYLLTSELTIESLERYIKALFAEDAVMKDLRRMPLAVVDTNPVSLGIIRKIFDFNKICNVDYYGKVDDLLASGEDYALYLLDMQLPGNAAEDWILKIRAASRDSRIMMMAGIEHYKAVSHILMSGADDFILKPFDLSIFMARVKSNARTLALIQRLKVARS